MSQLLRRATFGATHGELENADVPGFKELALYHEARILHAKGDEAAAKTTAENFEAAVAGKIPVYNSVYAYKRPADGRVVWIHALGHVVKDKDGKTLMKPVEGVSDDEIKGLIGHIRTFKK